MSSVSSRGRPRSIFTDEVLRSIPLWIELGADGLDIAAALGTTLGSLQYACHMEGISLRSSSPGIRQGLGAGRWAMLRREAEQRGVSAHQLLVNIVTAVVDDQLFNAVLDDGDLGGSQQ